MESLSIQADYVVVSPDHILHPGRIVVRQGRVVEVSSRRATADVDLGCVALLPGFINCHTHLEFSSLEQPFPPGESFPEWITSVLGWRFQQEKELDAQQLRTLRQRSVLAGLQECWLSGTCLLADIVTPPWSPDWLAAFVPAVAEVGNGELGSKLTQHLAGVSYPRVIALPEVLGHQAERFGQMLDWSSATVDQPRPEEVVDVGLSPHAPYSLRWDRASRAALLDSLANVRLAAMHVAESPAEQRWVADGQGAFDEFFRRHGIVTGSARLQFRDAIELLEKAKRGLLIHGYYLDRSSIERAAASRRLALVYCPRTCRHFGHRPLDLEQIREAGLPIVLGTDSRATNPDLSLWSELRALRRLHPQLAPRDALAMVTTLAAEALGVEQDFGSLGEGKLAFMNAVSLSASVRPDDLLTRLLSTERQAGKDSLPTPTPLFPFLTARDF